MSTGKKPRRLRSGVIVAVVGIALALVTTVAVARDSLRKAEHNAHDTLSMLLQQTLSFDEIQLSDRISELFGINENIVFLSKALENDPSLITDEYLEDFADGTKLTGVAVLDSELKLEASGYTRDRVYENWRDGFYGECLERIALTPEQIFLRRIIVDGQYYDVCAVSRRDKPGVVVGYYEHSMNLVYDTEENLHQLLGVVPTALDGNILIVHSGRIISNSQPDEKAMKFIESASGAFCYDKLNSVKFEGTTYYGMSLISGDHSIYIYFPAYTIFSEALSNFISFILLYTAVYFAIIAQKTHIIRKRQFVLEETNKKLQESLNVLTSLEAIYFTVFYVDIKKNKYQGFVMAPWIKSVVPENGEFSSSMHKLIEASVVEKYRADLEKSLGYEYVCHELNSRKINELRRSFYFDYQVIRNGECMWCRVTATAVDFDSNGDPIHILIMLQDVNYEKQKEADYQEQILYESELAQAANRAKSAFLFNISHDIRTPMTAILGYSDLAKKTMNDSEKLNHYLDNIELSGEALLSLTNELLEFARIENGVLVLDEYAASAVEGVDSCMVMIKPYADKKGITIDFEKNIIHPYICIDHKHLLRIVLNLMNNAVKFTQSGGDVKCRLSHIPTDDPEGFIVEIVVSDTGIGISEEFLPHMFETFEREKSATVSGIKGTGLGLVIVKKLVELMRGTVEVQSEIGKGTTFTVRLPAKVADPADSRREILEYHAKRGSVGNKRVLIAEDSDLNAEILSEILSAEGIDVERASDGKECIDMLSRAPKDYYQLILMDIQMPTMDGLSAAKDIRQDKTTGFSDIPIVAMSANAYSEDVERSLGAGMNGHLSKPINKNELMLILAKYINIELTAN